MGIVRNGRTLASAARTVVYGSAAVAFAFFHIETNPLLDAVAIGAVSADYITWMARSVAVLPNELVHGAYDGAVNILFAVLLFNVQPFDQTYDAEGFATGALIFFLVVVIKVVCYGIEYANYAMGDE